MLAFGMGAFRYGSVMILLTHRTTGMEIDSVPEVQCQEDDISKF
jgi:hypothetical protein